MINKGLYTSNTAEWATPASFFAELNREFGFTLDPCCTHENAKCARHFTKDDDGLSQNWGGEKVYCNPPYGREIKDWVAKAYAESTKPNTVCVMLLPARTDTRWFHKYIYHRAEIRFIPGRLHFNESKQSAPFPSMVVIFRSAD